MNTQAADWTAAQQAEQGSVVTRARRPASGLAERRLAPPAGSVSPRI